MATPRMSPQGQATKRKSADDQLAQLKGTKAYFDAHPEIGPAKRDLLESKVGLHPRRLKRAKPNGY